MCLYWKLSSDLKHWVSFYWFHILARFFDTNIKSCYSNVGRLTAKQVSYCIKFVRCITPPPSVINEGGIFQYLSLMDPIFVPNGRSSLSTVLRVADFLQCVRSPSTIWYCIASTYALILQFPQVSISLQLSGLSAVLVDNMSCYRQQFRAYYNRIHVWILKSWT